MSSDIAKCTCRAKSPPGKNHSSKPVVLELACRVESPWEIQNSWCLCSTRQIAVYWTWNVAWFWKCLKASPGCSKVQISLAVSSLSSNSGPISFSLFFSFQEAAKPDTPSCLRLTRHLVLGKEGRFPGFTHRTERPAQSWCESSSKEEQRDIMQGWNIVSPVHHVVRAALQAKV